MIFLSLLHFYIHSCLLDMLCLIELWDLLKTGISRKKEYGFLTNYIARRADGFPDLQRLWGM